MRKINTYSHRNAEKLIEKSFLNKLKHRLSNISQDKQLVEIKNEVKSILKKFDFEVPGKDLFPGSNKYLAAFDSDNKVVVS